MKKKILTGIKPTGTPHLGNYLGAIRPAIELSQSDNFETFLFIADYHALTALHEAKLFTEYYYEVVATWLACGVDPKKITLFRQSDISEIFELSWILSCITPKGFLNRAHAYKAQVALNEEKGSSDLDANINQGLYSYPVLMAADILSFDTDIVPIGKDQIQHLEMTRDIAQRFNNAYGDVFKLPEAYIHKSAYQVLGLDGQKMSKSYNNTIPLFCPEKRLQKLINSIKTDSSSPDEPKETQGSILFELYEFFANIDEIKNLEDEYKRGISWGRVKENLFEVMNRELSPKREIYNELIVDKKKIDEIIRDGSTKAKEVAKKTLEKVRKSIGKV